jgi:ABC-type lipoprotein export system ATPase subunit/ABC-type lipoprotein release transport system permease subunit
VSEDSAALAGSRPPLVSLTGVSKTVAGNIQALRDATTIIRPQDFVAIVGPSGSGKTTLLSILGLLDTTTTGEYLFDGVDVARLDEDGRNELRSRRVGFVFQNSYLNADESVAENVALGLRVRGVPSDEQLPLVAVELARVGLAGFEDRRAGDLSGGEKQRVSVARALVTAPDLLLADEPTGALDSDSTAALVALLGEISSQDTAVVVVTHDPIVGGAAARVLEIRDGVLRETTESSDEITGQARDDGKHSRDDEEQGRDDEKHSRDDERQRHSDGRQGRNGMPLETTESSDEITGQARDDGKHSRDDEEQGHDDGGVRLSSTRLSNGELHRSIPPAGNVRTAHAMEVLDALKAPLLRPLRSVLVLLAYVLGITSLTASLALTQSATGSIVERLTEAASNEIRVTTTESDDNFLLDPTLPDGAIAQLKAVDGVATAVPVRTFGPQANGITRALPASHNNAPTIFPGRLFVTETDYLVTYGLTAASGRIDLLSNTWGGRTVVLGALAAENLGVSEAGPDMGIWVNGHLTSVVAVLTPTGDPLVDSAAFFSRAVAPYLQGAADAYLLVRTHSGWAEPLAKAIPLVLRPTNAGAIQVSTVSQLANLQAGIRSDLVGFLGIIAGVVLVLSGLSAGTAMLLSVQHRVPEIALRRAFGASRGAIWRLFMYEGIALGVAGGVIGVAAGTVFAASVAHLKAWPLSLGLPIPLVGLAVGVLVGALASALPALAAARQQPAQILRGV